LLVAVCLGVTWVRVLPLHIASFYSFILFFMRLCKDWPEDNHIFLFSKISPSFQPTLIDRSSTMDISLSV
jgi:hypothetical protein